jgi:hypothetical protein
MLACTGTQQQQANNTEVPLLDEYWHHPVLGGRVGCGSLKPQARRKLSTTSDNHSQIAVSLMLVVQG